MIARLRAFAAFWYDFVVGDDWQIAAGVVIALIVTAVLAHTGTPAWWVLPVVLLVLLPYSLWRATRRQ